MSTERVWPAAGVSLSSTGMKPRASLRGMVKVSSRATGVAPPTGGGVGVGTGGGDGRRVGLGVL